MKKFAIAALLLGALGTAHGAGDAAAGQAKAAVCAACHNMDGNSVNPIWPNLAGQSAAYITKQLMDFKAGARKDDTMTAMVAPLSDEDVADLAAHFSSQKGGVGSANAETAVAGKKLYTGGDKERGISACMACHGPNGSGIPAAKFPALSGQHSAYVIKALKDFRSGTRSNDPGGMMRNVAAKMTDAQMEAVAEYITGLH